MKVLISGAGIAGLTLADWLVQFGHNVTLVERELNPAKSKGYIIDFWGPGFVVAERMGIVGELAQRKCEPEEWRVVVRSGRPVARMNVQRFAQVLGGRVFSFFRGDLEEVLFDRVRGKIDLRTSSSIERLEDCGDRIQANLTGGATESWDLAVGADGVHSNVRTLVFGPEEDFSTYLGCEVSAVILPVDASWRLENAAYLYNEPGRLVMLFQHPLRVIAVYFVNRTTVGLNVDSAQGGACAEGVWRHEMDYSRRLVRHRRRHANLSRPCLPNPNAAVEPRSRGVVRRCVPMPHVARRPRRFDGDGRRLCVGG